MEIRFHVAQVFHMLFEQKWAQSYLSMEEDATRTLACTCPAPHLTFTASILPLPSRPGKTRVVP